jgi:hypothetical protein
MSIERLEKSDDTDLSTIHFPETPPSALQDTPPPFVSQLALAYQVPPQPTRANTDADRSMMPATLTDLTVDNKAVSPCSNGNITMNHDRNASKHTGWAD